jgi:O-antigen ligase
MITAIIGLVGGMALYFSHAPSDKRVKISAPRASILAIVVLFCFVLTTLDLSRAEAIERIFADDGAMDDRTDYWSSGLGLFWQYFPLGFGPGAFVPVFQMEEPMALLSSAYLNRLHNDWLETALAFGLHGILLLSCAAAYFIWRFVVLWIQMDGRHTAVALGRMASVIIIILGIASTSDYPLSAPAMIGFFALVLVWLAGARQDRALYN